MLRVDIKPLSTNKCWLGRRIKSKDYRDYTEVLLELLEETFTVPVEGDLFVYYKWGLANRGFDVDNPIKPFQDILQQKYGFNDSHITFLMAEKTKVKKGEEYIEFDIRLREDVAVCIYDTKKEEVIYEEHVVY